MWWIVGTIGGARARQQFRPAEAPGDPANTIPFNMTKDVQPSTSAMFDEIFPAFFCKERLSLLGTLCAQSPTARLLRCRLFEIQYRLGGSKERPDDVKRARAIAHSLNNMLCGVIAESVDLAKQRVLPVENAIIARAGRAGDPL